MGGGAAGGGPSGGGAATGGGTGVDSGVDAGPELPGDLQLEWGPLDAGPGTFRRFLGASGACLPLTLRAFSDGGEYHFPAAQPLQVELLLMDAGQPFGQGGASPSGVISSQCGTSSAVRFPADSGVAAVAIDLRRFGYFRARATVGAVTAPSPVLQAESGGYLLSPVDAGALVPWVLFADGGTVPCLSLELRAQASKAFQPGDTREALETAAAVTFTLMQQAGGQPADTFVQSCGAGATAVSTLTLPAGKDRVALGLLVRNPDDKVLNTFSLPRNLGPSIPVRLSLEGAGRLCIASTDSPGAECFLQSECCGALSDCSFGGPGVPVCR